MSGIAAPGAGYVGAIARVDLLPKEIRDRAAVRATRRSMLAIIVFAIVAAVAGLAAVQWAAAVSAADLATAQARTAALTSQQAEYQRVKAMQSALAEADSIHEVTTRTQIDWNAMLDEALQPLPSSVGYTTISVSSQTPTSDPQQTTSPFGQAAIGSMQLALSSSDQDALNAWLARMRADAKFASVSALSTQNADGDWSLSATLYISPSVTALPSEDATAAPTAAANGGN